MVFEISLHSHKYSMHILLAAHKNDGAHYITAIWTEQIQWSARGRSQALSFEMANVWITSIPLFFFLVPFAYDPFRTRYCTLTQWSNLNSRHMLVTIELPYVVVKSTTVAVKI